MNLGADLLEGWVELAVVRVVALHDVGVLRGDSLGGADGGLARGFDGRVGVDAGSGEEGCTEGAAFFGFEKFNGVVVDVGLDLAPEGAAGAAAAEADAVVGDAEFVQEGEGVLEGERYALEDGADEVAAGGGGGDADEGGPG